MMNAAKPILILPPSLTMAMANELKAEGEAAGYFVIFSSTPNDIRVIDAESPSLPVGDLLMAALQGLTDGCIEGRSRFVFELRKRLVKREEVPGGKEHES